MQCLEKINQVDVCWCSIATVGSYCPTTAECESYLNTSAGFRLVRGDREPATSETACVNRALVRFLVLSDSHIPSVAFSSKPICSYWGYKSKKKRVRNISLHFSIKQLGTASFIKYYSNLSIWGSFRSILIHIWCASIYGSRAVSFWDWVRMNYSAHVQRKQDVARCDSMSHVKVFGLRKRSAAQKNRP